MDKLPEPYFESDKNWPRLKLGVDDYNKEKRNNFLPYFAIFSAGSIFRYWREVTYYKKNNSFFLFVIVPTFLFSSYQLAEYFNRDVYGVAASRNNENERKYIEEYRALYREYKRKNLEIPDELVR